MLTSRVSRATSALALLLACACSSTGSWTESTKAESDAPRTLAPVELTNEMTATAEVTNVDKATRIVTLRREDGDLFQVLAGAEVRNFDQIATGDLLRVRFKESLRATLRPPGEAGPEAGGAMVATRAPKGGTPAAGLGVGVSVRVKIESIDLERGIVVCSLPSGELVSHRIATEQGKTFLEGLRIGDKVQLDYAQSLALAIEKV